MATTKRELIDTTAYVESPEHIRFHYLLAGPAKRALAYLIDTLLRGVIMLLVSMIAAVAGVAGGELGGASMGMFLLLLFLMECGYYVLFETIWSGRSPGKRALRIRVVSEGGHPLNFVNSLLRNLLRAADFLPAVYALGLVVMGRDPRFRRLGDLVAGTMVVVEERPMVDGPIRIDPPVAHWELAQLPERMLVTGDDIEAIELFLRRCLRLAPARQYELAQMVAPLYARRMAIPPPTNPHRFLALVYVKARGGVG